MNGAESLVRTLVDSGVEVCFSNPGTSEMHAVAALDRIEGMRAVLGLFEGVVTGMADGYGRMAGKPAMTLLHLGPGLANGLANLHNARRAATPIVNVVGDHAMSHQQYDAPLASDIAGFARRYGFRGAIYPINPGRAEVQGLKAFRSIAETPAAPDLAIIAVAGDEAVRAVEECAARGVQVAVVMTSGFGELGEADQRDAGFGNSGLFTRDRNDVGTEEMLMVESEASDRRHQRPFDDVRRVEPTAKADFEDARVRRGPNERQERHRGRDLEEARLDSVAPVEHLGQQRGERLIVDQSAGNANPLVEPDEVRAGEGVDLVPRRFERGSEEGDRRALAIGAGDVEHWRKPVLRPSEPIEKLRNPLQAQSVAGRREHRQPVELRLDFGIRRTREVGHQAAAFFSGFGAR